VQVSASVVALPYLDVLPRIIMFRRNLITGKPLHLNLLVHFLHYYRIEDPDVVQ
jgi:hypothetical protein